MIVKESRRSCFYFGENINLRLAVYMEMPEKLYLLIWTGT